MKEVLGHILILAGTSVTFEILGATNKDAWIIILFLVAGSALICGSYTQHATNSKQIDDLQREHIEENPKMSDDYSFEVGV